MTPLRARQKLDKYRIECRLGEGGFATVYRAVDTIEGIRVALKVPHPHLLTDEMLTSFRQEVRLTAALDHPNILPIKNAGFIGNLFVVASPLGKETLADRLRRRLARPTALSYARQLIDAVAYAQSQRISHCDLKPENVILFDHDHLRVTDFGIARVALRTVAASASGSGTVGYVAPEQALGRPSFRSDVFSLGLMLYEMFTGHLPRWPYAWPPDRIDRLRRDVHRDFIALLQRATELDERRRFADALQFQAAFDRIRPRALTVAGRRRRRAHGAPSSTWRTLHVREFRRRFGKGLETRDPCDRCGNPCAESMHHCPWCGKHRATYKGKTPFPRRCKRCRRGMKADWRFCAWCYGPGTGVETGPRYSDVRYAARCKACGERQMPFTRYCPWCRAKVRRPWRIEGSTRTCTRCGWGTLPEFWSHCAWCGKRVREGPP